MMKSRLIREQNHSLCEKTSDNEVSLVDPTAMPEKAEVEAELLPSAEGSRAGVLKAS